MASEQSKQETPFVPGPMSQLSAAAERLRARSDVIATAAAGLSALVVLTALQWSSGVLAFAAVITYALMRPAAESGLISATRTRLRADKDLGAERQAIVEAFPDPAWMLDRAGIVVSANRPARTIFPNLRTGIHVSSAVRNPDVIEAVDRAAASSAVQTADLHERVPIERRLTAVVAPLRLEETRDSDPAMLICLRDLTEQDRLAQMRADFVANASHELRTPLASLRGFVETLQGPARNDPAARERFLAIMSAQADRMTRLIDDLLSLSRVEMRQHLAPTDQVDIVGVCEKAIHSLEPQAADADVTLNLQAPDRPLPVRGDGDELLQVVQNLVQNAIKYGREGGRVEILVSRLQSGNHSTPGRISVAVKDDGHGIGAAHIPRLTERFYRVNAAQSRDKGGTGLGLAIVKHIVTRHGGALQIVSSVGKGSTFTFTLDASE